MTVFRKFAIVLLAGVAVFVGLMTPDKPVTRGSLSIVSTAEAVVGRPLTPVSVAGVARRSAR